MTHTTKGPDGKQGRGIAHSAAFKQGLYMVAELKGRADDGTTVRLSCSKLKTRHFDPVTLRFREVMLPDGRHTLAVDRRGDLGAVAPVAATPVAATRKRQPREGKRVAFERMVAQGWTNAAIAGALGMKPDAVRQQRRRLQRHTTQCDISAPTVTFQPVSVTYPANVTPMGRQPGIQAG